jgi:hypothetical protein
MLPFCSFRSFTSLSPVILDKQLTAALLGGEGYFCKIHMNFICELVLHVWIAGEFNEIIDLKIINLCTERWIITFTLFCVLKLLTVIFILNKQLQFSVLKIQNSNVSYN